MDGISSMDEFKSLAVTPIAQLSPSLDNANQRYLHATVILLWPFSSATRQFSLLLSEPDFRLRGSRGQVKVGFRDQAAEAAAKSKIGIGDNIFLALDGVDWKSRGQEDPSSDIGIDWDLLLRDRVLLEVQRNSETLSTINIERPSNGTPQQTGPSATVAAPANGVGTPTPSASKSWSSPAFARTTDASFPTSVFDRSAEEDGYIFGKGRKRTKFSRPSSDWVFLDTPPSPIKTADISDSEGSEDDNESEGREAAHSREQSPISPHHMASPSDGRSMLKRPEVPELIVNTPQTQDSGQETKDNANPLTHIPSNENNSIDNIAAIQTPYLHPLPSPGMPIVSPLETSLAASANYHTPSTPTPGNNTVSLEIIDHEPKSPPTLIDRSATPDIVDNQRSHSVEETTDVAAHGIYSETSIRDNLSSHEPAIDGLNQNVPADGNIEAAQVADIVNGSYIVSDEEFSEGIETGTLLKEEDTELLNNRQHHESSHEYMAEQTSELLESESESRQSVGRDSDGGSSISSAKRDYQSPSRVSPSPSETSNKEVIALDDDELESSDVESASVSYHRETDISQLPNGTSSQADSLSEESVICSSPSEGPEFNEFTEDVPSRGESDQSASVNSDTNMENIPADIAIAGLETEVTPPQLSPLVVPSSSASPRSETIAEDTAMGEIEAEVQHYQQDSISATGSARTSPVDPGLIFDGTSNEIFSHFTEANLDLESRGVHQLITPHDTQGSFNSLAQKPALAVQLDPNLPTPDLSQNAGFPLAPFPSVAETVELLPSSAINVDDPSRPQPVDQTSDVEAIADSPTEHSRESSLLPEKVEIRTPETRSSAIYGSEKSETPIPNSSLKESFGKYDTAETGTITRSNTQTSGFRTPFSYFCPLSRLIENFNQGTDTISFVMDVSPVSRANKGAKEFYTTLRLTDPSSAGSVTTAQIFQKNKNTLPTATSGDVILLRNFRVQSMNHNMSLSNVKDSAWAVFTQGKDEEDVKIEGPPVEFGPEERAYTEDLRKWYEREGAGLVRENQSLRASTSIGASSMSPSESGSQSSRGNIFKRHRRPRRSTGSSRITVHTLRRGRRYVDVGSPSDKESIHELRDGTVYAHPSD